MIYRPFIMAPSHHMPSSHHGQVKRRQRSFLLGRMRSHFSLRQGRDIPGGPLTKGTFDPCSAYHVCMLSPGQSGFNMTCRTNSSRKGIQPRAFSVIILVTPPRPRKGLFVSRRARRSYKWDSWRGNRGFHPIRISRGVTWKGRKNE